jgi:amino acid transporter
MAEMVTYAPISSPFIRFAGRYVDEAFGVAAGYNFFVFEAMLVPFEIVACNVIVSGAPSQFPQNTFETSTLADACF